MSPTLPPIPLPHPVQEALGRHVAFDQAWELVWALSLHAGAMGEVPVGAVVLDEASQLQGAGYDARMLLHDPTAHAEILALRHAAQRLGDWRLDGSTLLVSLEPCPMCAGAILMARVARLRWAAASPKFGAVGSLTNLLQGPVWNHSVDAAPDSPEHAQRAATILRDWFRDHRKSG